MYQIGDHRKMLRFDIRHKFIGGVEPKTVAFKKYLSSVLKDRVPDLEKIQSSRNKRMTSGTPFHYLIK